MPTGTNGRQTSFAQMQAADAKAEDDRRRRLASDRARVRDAGEAALAMTDPDRVEAVRQLEHAFCDFLRRVGEGREFQSQRFTEWLDTSSRRPVALDPRAIGGVVMRAQSAGLIESTHRYEQTGGVRTTNTKGSPRRVWRVVKLPKGDAL